VRQISSQSAEIDVFALARCFILLALFAFAVSPAAAQGTDAILILDASGSMWGQVEGQTKIAAARRAVDSILSKWRPSDRLGLIAYGHRSKGDCKDIEMVVPVTRFDSARIRNAVAALNPKGKTPIADSLRAAATSLRTTEGKGTVVLVSDGIETCVADPCAVAAELKKAGIGFVAHVIGFDVADPAAKAQLQCIARATGGVYLDARDASGLENALGRAVEATQGGRVQSEAPARPVEDPYRGKNIRGLARLAAGLDPITDLELGWLVHKPAAGNEKGEYLTRFDGSPFAGEIAPGNYVVEVEYGLVKRTVPVTVDPGKQAVLDVALNAGYVTSEGAVQGGGTRVDDVSWEVLDRNGNWLATEYRPLPRFVLQAGDYMLRLKRGLSSTEKAFSIAAGDAINVAMTVDAGKLLVSGVYAPGGAKIENGFSVEIRKVPAAAGEDGAWVATNYDALSQFELPSGSYDVVTMVGFARRVTRAEVRSGAPTRLEVNLDAGVANIKTGAGKVIEIFGTERDINNQRKYVQTSYDPTLTVALNAGNYVAVVEYADGGKVEKEFSIAAGKRADIEVGR
jgi:Ca-activated chloride channel family protein